MASALTILFFGCWLAGQSRAGGQGPPQTLHLRQPRGVIPVGGNVTIRWWTEQWPWKFALSKDGDGNYTNYKDAAGSAAEFPTPSSWQEDGGSYTCRYSNRTGGFSAPSASVQIRVAGEDPSQPGPRLPADTGSTPTRRTNSTPLGTTSAPSPSLKDAGSTPARGTHPTLLGTTSAPSPSTTDAGSTPGRGNNSAHRGTTSASSPSTTDTGFTPAKETSSTGNQLETTAAQTQPGESGSNLSGSIVTGVIVGAAGLFLLLVFFHRRRTRTRKGPASRQSRESEAATTVYALEGQGKQQDVLTPNPDAEGLTYAELDHQALQAKRYAPAPDPEPVLYAAISRSQGVLLLPPKTEPGQVTETTGMERGPPRVMQ